MQSFESNCVIRTVFIILVIINKYTIIAIMTIQWLEDWHCGRCVV